ncbi:alpha/beta fold hydrolase [Streptomyces beigongshangae]|uniref:alpha/beta fold hydrolase n=1 Tax=Streptomyces beigongshangae TaxID=2841597 RepID=UPI001C84C34E|nr:alpha/beta fold hydrolase [Streptomyces sp. REN17]
MAPFLAYGDSGPRASTAPPLVLIHGHPFDRTMWAPQVAAFSPDRRVVTPDLRGYGASPVVPGTTPFAVLVEDVAALLDDLRIPEFVLGGLSMGGQIAMEFHRLFPGRVRGLLLADTSPAAETPAGRKSRNATADRLLREGMAGYAEEVLYGMVAPYARPEVAAHVHRMMTGTPPEGAAAALRGRAERPDYRELLTRVGVPTLVVVGEDDGFTPVAEAQAMHEALPDSVLRVVRGAAHLPNLERPADFNEAVAGLLARV